MVNLSFNFSWYLSTFPKWGVGVGENRTLGLLSISGLGKTFQKLFKTIWSYEIKALILHPLSRGMATHKPGSQPGD